MQYTSPHSTRYESERRSHSLDFEVDQDNDFPLFPERPRDMIRRDRDLPPHLQTREATILEASPYFSDSQSAGRILNRVGHKAKTYGFDGEAPQHIALVAGLAFRYKDNKEALRSIGEKYVDLVRKNDIIPRDSLTKVRSSLEAAIRRDKILSKREKRNPANLPRLL